MKILIAGEIFIPDIGGPATYSQKLAEELSSRNWTVNLICYSDKKNNDAFNFKVYRIIRSKVKGWHYFKYFFKLFLLAYNCDLIYAQGPIASGLPAIVAGKILRKKIVVKIVGDYAWEQARNLKITEAGIDEFQKNEFSGKIGRLKILEAFTCRHSAKVIVPSEYLKKIVSGWGIDLNKIQVIYNAPSVPFFTASAESKKRQENLIVSVGRLVPWKGFFVLIEIMPDLLAVNKDFILKIFGSGPEKNKLQELVKCLKLEQKIFISNISHDKLMIELCSAGIFVLNTGYEGLSHTILEAMAAEAPVLATNIGGNPELIKNEENGLLVEYNNKKEIKEAILKLYQQPALRQKFTEASKFKLKKFTFENMINQTVNALELI